MKIYNFVEDEDTISRIYYFIAPKTFEYYNFEKKIIEMSNVRKDSLAEKYLTFIFKSMFKYLIDLKKDYDDYYNLEYNSFEDYLYNKELLETNDINTLMNDLNEKETVYLANIALSSYNADNLFAYDEDIIKKINQLLARCKL